MSEWPEKLRIRDTGLHDDMGGAGQQIFTTAGQGYAKRVYVRGDLHEALEKQLAELQAKVAEYEYPLRTKETVTVPIEVWDAREQQLAELSKRNAKLVNICCLYDVPEAALLQGKGPKPPE